MKIVLQRDIMAIKLYYRDICKWMHLKTVAIEFSKTNSENSFFYQKLILESHWDGEWYISGKNSNGVLWSFRSFLSFCVLYLDLDFLCFIWRIGLIFDSVTKVF